MNRRMYKFRAALIITLTNLLICSSIFAQAPQKMSYQAVIRDANNNLVTNHAVGIRISILRGSATGTLSYREIYNPDPQTNANGLVTIEIGSGIALTGSLDTINWAKGTYYISVETDPTGATSYTITGTSQLLSVPYALYSGSAANGFSGNYNDLTNKPTFATVATSGSYNDLSNQPTIPATQVNSDWNSNSGLSQILNKPTLFSGAYSDLTGAPTLATIATSGSYNDLTNKPTILAGTVAGQMQYWNGTAWVTIAAGLNGQILEYKNGVPTWVDNNINNLNIGDSYQGGVIAYFLVPGDPGYDANVRHGLIAAPSDQSIGIQWYNGGFTTTGATGTALGTGNANTNTIVTSQGAGSYAAKLCADLVLGGYSDWYLPSKDELNKLYLNKVAVGGFASYYYWSSSEDSQYYTWGQYLVDGTQNSYGKSGTFYVRAIRSF